MYPPNRNGLRPNNAGLSPPILAIPKRRSLNNLNDHDENSPDSTYSDSTKGKGKKDKGKRKSKPTPEWFVKTTGGDSESDDEPGPSRGRRKIGRSTSPSAPVFNSTTSVGGSVGKGWKAALGLGSKKGSNTSDDMAAIARDENKARKAALAAESGSLFVGVDAPPTSVKRGFVVKRQSGVPTLTTPIEMGGLTGGTTSPGERSFRVKRIGQPTPQALASPPATQSASGSGLSSPVIQPEEPVRSFKVKRPQQNPSSPGSLGSNSLSRQQSPFIVNRPYSEEMTTPKPKPMVSAEMGYPPTSFIPISEGRGSVDGAPFRPPKNPRRASEESYRGTAL